jgi:SAM-dependent methyltransferase
MNERILSCLSIARRCSSGELSPQVALMRMLIATEDLALVEQALSSQSEPALAAVCAELAGLLNDNRAGCARIVEQLRHEQAHTGALSSEASLAFHRQLFDDLVAVSEESSVALYSLGNPEILSAATDEIVRFLDARELLGAHARVLDLGCGIGRLELALSARVFHITGLDLSPQMVSAARRRCAQLVNVRIALTSGRDFAGLPPRSLSLVLAVDSFPYVVQAGEALVDALFDEAKRVLTPDGHLALLNFSYRDDLARDQRDVEVLAQRHGFVVELCGERPFSLWDGAVFLLRATDSLSGGG